MKRIISTCCLPILILALHALSFAATESQINTVSPAWGISSRLNGDTRLEHGWSSAKPPEYKFTKNGVDLVLCYQWSCSETVLYSWDLSHLESISDNIAQCSSSAEQELLALRNAIRDTEKEIMKQVEYLAHDIAGNELDKDRYGRLDCVDNSSNTNTILRVLEKYRPFKFWQVYKTQRDGYFRPHLSASVITKDQKFIEKYRPKTRIGKKDYTVWVVDTWLTTFSEKPFLYEVNDWKHKLDPWGNKLYFGLYEKPLSCWQ